MWLLESEIEKIILGLEKDGFAPTAEQQSEFLAFSSASADEAESRIMKIAGDTAEINIKGALTNTPNLLAMLFGGGNTTYQEIISAISLAENNEDISKIILAIDSPGGQVDGLFSAINAIATISKPVKAIVSNMAASAAYALAAQADEIIALNEATQVGSIGILTSIKVDESKINITSTKAPKKAPDITTKEGVAIIRENLDAFHDIFVETIARGRDVVPDAVNKDFGQGGTLLAKEALRKGMIDSISSPVIKVGTGPTITDNFDNAATAIDGELKADTTKSLNKNGDKITKKDGKTNTKKEAVMTLQELQASHPTIFAEAFELGVTKERDRASAHLTMGEASGDMVTAVKAIKDGSEMTQALQANYLAANMKKTAIGDRAGDDPGNIDAAGGAPGADGSGGADAADVVADKLEEILGIDSKGGAAHA